MDSIRTLLLFPFLPGCAALCHAETRLWRVYLIQGVGLIGLAAIVLGVDQLATPTVRWQPVAIVLADELAFLAIASWMTCRAGADEPVGHTWRHAVRVSWLYVSTLGWVVGGAGIAINLADGQPETFALAYGAFVAFLIVWSIVSDLRALTAPRSLAPVEHPSVCEGCGYNLTNLPPESVCPECARPTSGSNRQRVRLDEIPPLWGNYEAWFRGERLFRRIAVQKHSAFAVRFLTMRLLAAGLTGGVAIVTVMNVRYGAPPVNVLAALAVLFLALLIA